MLKLEYLWNGHNNVSQNNIKGKNSEKFSEDRLGMIKSHNPGQIMLFNKVTDRREAIGRESWTTEKKTISGMLKLFSHWHRKSIAHGWA